MSKKMINLLVEIFVVVTLAVSVAQSQESTSAQSITLGQDKGTQQPPAAPTALATYTKWRTDTLLNYPQGLLTPHYAVAIVAERLDDSTAQVELLLAAEMKHYTITIKPVTLNRLASGETTTTLAGNAVTIDQKAGEKFGTGSDKIRLGQTTTLVAINKSVQALEIIWEPKNDNAGDFANTCIVTLGKEPTVTVNGYIFGAPIK